MAQDWRLAVCTRWRPLATLILVCLSLLFTGIVIFSIYYIVDQYPTRGLERRIHKVKVGMSVAELESILGPPDSRTDKVKKENLDLDEGSSDKIVEYRYSTRSWPDDTFTPTIGGVFVDENTGKVVSIHLSRGWSVISDGFWSEWGVLFAVGLMILVALIVMLCFKRWCQSVTDVEEDK